MTSKSNQIQFAQTINPIITLLPTTTQTITLEFCETQSLYTQSFYKNIKARSSEPHVITTTVSQKRIRPTAIGRDWGSFTIRSGRQNIGHHGHGSSLDGLATEIHSGSGTAVVIREASRPFRVWPVIPRQPNTMDNSQGRYSPRGSPVAAGRNRPPKIFQGVKAGAAES